MSEVVKTNKSKFGGLSPLIDQMREMHEKGQYSTSNEKLTDDEIEQLMECVSENEVSKNEIS